MMQRFFKGVDWSILFAVIPLLLAGMTTMVSFGSRTSIFDKQELSYKKMVLPDTTYKVAIETGISDM
jgi:uncharacterized BrkB/YihY/UPF0761 family membrane protein